jgi:transposase
MSVYHVKSPRTIKRWITLENEENNDLAVDKPSYLNKNRSVKEDPESESAVVRSLQKQLADAQLKIAALNTLIDVAEEHLKIDIRKKPGAKQS